ncbi:type I-C CRISPR-associated protein Cas8c/Csd1 [Basfia succiniciproducens]|uniref:CRISPR-associated protein Csd1 n=1 Tax=Basfia succiniciproducens TaxID=653940 RepID=A0A1G5BK82_9PAST|nr:type I-C CRISPR-associated protein Cas8c/Csd1 [Basfia succiniciproducens]QIM68373.1 type I-C CRISPR-associated protein Cas8c/Csd1 [Basfia succiniciproducens]SCX90538.1 CRISPR-associated protein Csd1 [Basfia succiniciproducens]
MILSSLARYYQRLAKETDSVGNPKVPSYGFSEEKIGWVLVINQDGQLVDVVPNLSDGKKPLAKSMVVPQSFKRPGVTPKPFFLWDKTAYVLGVESNKDKATAKEQPFVISQKTFEAFKQSHLELFKDSQDLGLQAVCRFLEKWQPEHFSQPPCLTEMLDANLVFKLDGCSGYIHQREAAQTLWADLLKDDNAEQGICLISGANAPIARLHPAIKGVFGGQSSGGSIISFNKESFASFGKEQGSNAPVSEASAFAYTTTLNYLLREKAHRLSIGDTSTVFWAEADNSANAEAAVGFLASVFAPPDDEQESKKVFYILEQIAKGRPLQEVAPELSPDTRFYILGLAPNAARISVRFWLDTTFGQLADNMARYWRDLHIEPPAWRGKPPAILRILLETTPKRKGADGRLKKSESKDIPPQLAGEYMRSILTGRAYPKTMLTRMIGRIRSDGYISGLRVAVIKAVINRNSLYKEELTMGLNEETKDIPYRLGRLFAIIELAQSSALGELNAGVRDKFYGGASSSPHSTFPILLDNYRTHIAGLRKGKKAKWVKGDSKKLANWLEAKVGEIVGVFDAETPFPRHLSLEEQGRFVVGYYHQRFKKYNKQEDSNIPDDIEQANHLTDDVNAEDEEN